MDLLEYMQDYQDLLGEVVKLHKAFAKKWKSQIQKQPSISSYSTTRRAQLRTIRSSESIVPHVEALRTSIAEVITDLKRQVDRLYTNRGVGRTPKHHRSDELRNAFKSARSSVKHLSEELETWRGKAKRAQEEEDQAALQFEQLEYAGSTSKSKLAKAKDHLTDKQIALNTSNERVTRIEQELKDEQLTYKQKATEIFGKCQICEQERLDLIRESLIKFVQAMHSLEYSKEVDSIFDDLLIEIENKLNTDEDLRFWAETYGVTVPSQTDDDEEEVSETPVPQPAPEAPAEAVVQEATTVTETATPAVDPTKTVNKKKKKQNTTATEEVTPDTLPEESVWKANEQLR